MLRQFDDDGRRVGVVKDVLELGVGVAVVHVHRNGAQLDGRNQRLHVFGAVLQEERYLVVGTDSPRREEVCDLVGLPVHLRVSGLIALVAEDDALGDRVGDRFEDVGEVELHGGDSLVEVRWLAVG